MSDWIKPRFGGKPEPEQRWRRYKVIRLNWVWGEGKHEAVKAVEEDPATVDVICAVEEKPKGWVGNLLKQLLG